MFVTLARDKTEQKPDLLFALTNQFIHQMISTMMKSINNNRCDNTITHKNLTTIPRQKEQSKAKQLCNQKQKR